jgi:Kef-type K+ transport system membrane component KefB
MNDSAEANIVMALSIVFPVLFIIASKWLVPLLARRLGDKAKTVYFLIAFAIIMAIWYAIDTRYGFHMMGLW